MKLFFINYKSLRAVFLFVSILSNATLDLYSAHPHVPGAEEGITPYIEYFHPNTQTGRFLRNNADKINQFFIQPILRNPNFIGNISNPFAPKIQVAGAQVSDILSIGKLGFYHEFAQYWNDGHFDEMLTFFAPHEAANSATHFVFYHGQNNLITAYQDLMKTIFKIEGDAIRIFRVPTHEFDNANIALVYQNTRDYSTFDGQFKHSLLAASENLFAGTFGYYNRLTLNSNSESALSYFFRASATGGSMLLGNQSDVISEICEFMHISQDRQEALRQEFNQIVKDYNLKKTQSLLQIFVPKDLTNELVCLARPTGCIIRLINGFSVRDYLEHPNLNMLDYWQFDIISTSISCTTKSPYIQNECKISLSNAPQVRIYPKNEYFLRRRLGLPNVEVYAFNRDTTWNPHRNAEYLHRIAQLAAKFNI